MFNAVGEKTLYIFGTGNIITLPMVWALYPESNQCTLDEMGPLFAADRPWVWDAEKNFAKLTEQHPEPVAAARRGSSIVDPESGVGGTRRMGVWQEWQVQRLGRRVH